jgi:hypothetical protein
VSNQHLGKACGFHSLLLTPLYQERGWVQHLHCQVYVNFQISYLTFTEGWLHFIGVLVGVPHQATIDILHRKQWAPVNTPHVAFTEAIDG